MWSQLTGDALWNVLSQPEIDFFNSQALESGQTDRVTEIVGWVAAMVRGKIAAYPENLARLPLDDLSLIPPELFFDAVQIARYSLLTSFPQGKMFLDEARMQGYRDAMKHLDDVATGKLIVESSLTGSALNPPDSVIWGSRDGGGPVFCGPYHRTDWGFWH